MTTRRSFIGQVIGFIGAAPLIAENPPIKYDRTITQMERILQTLKLPDEILLNFKIILMSFEEEFVVVKVNRIERFEGGFKLHLPDIYMTQPIEINGCKLIDPNNWFVDHRVNGGPYNLRPGDTLRFNFTMIFEVR